MAHIAELLTEQHFDRIAAFCDARIDAIRKAHIDTLRPEGHIEAADLSADPVLRATWALRVAVERLRSRSVLIGGSPASKMARGLTVDFAWSDLCAIAREWDDHPDHLPEFTTELPAFMLAPASGLTDGGA